MVQKNNKSFSKLLLAIMLVAGTIFIGCMAASCYLLALQSQRSPETAYSELHNQAVDAVHRKDFVDAEKKYREALDMAKKSSDRSRYPKILGELADVYYSENKLSAGEESLREVISDYQEIIRTDLAMDSSHKLEMRQKCAIQQGRLANVLKKQGKLKEAEQLYAQAIDEDTSAGGDIFAQDRLQKDYIDCLRRLGRTHDAENIEMNMQAKDIMASSWTDANGRGMELLEQGKVKEADKILKITHLAAVRFSPSFKLSVNLMGQAFSMLLKGDPSGAENELQQAIKEMNASGEAGEHQIDLASQWVLLSYTQFLNGKTQASEASYKKALVFEPTAGTRLNPLAIAYERLGKFKEQHQLFEWVCDSEAKAGSPHAFTLCLIANHYKDQGHLTEAEKLCKQALAICDQTEKAHPNRRVCPPDSRRLVLPSQGLQRGETAV